ncbi:Oligoxyloglucan reducing end-specific cellobiohydrolase [Jaminaea rosea]|uniref:Oligoxyloglucan reducing end-specific cellobiohydrolase n=1 Tax=Jaminaea rosea TaxID=1569628 RepID=A0A316UVV3_9BASI|nr:Oligoxyloglucan reducing end-specific cellobiohydrolase [Jaminaea rosea]PWN28461.1 Oligoxyloglucan reducing end-specific cellobiohydrolase [Jaminaea rosea]
MLLGRPSSSLFMRLGLIAVLVAAILAIAPEPTLAAGQPGVSISRFESLPGRLSYFDDSTVVLYHDTLRGNVYRSEDEGKAWKQVSGPPGGSAYMLVEHPYDKRMAFILSSGKSHWRSADRGKTWQEFKTPEPPAVRAGPPLEFNADEKHYDFIIFTGKKCKPWTPWGGAICHDEAYVTRDGFATDPKPLIEFLIHCSWAKATPELAVKQEHLQRIFCIAWEDSPTPSVSTALNDPMHMMQTLHSRGGYQSAARRDAPSATRLFYSDDFFGSRRLVEFDMGRDAKHFVGLGPSKRYLVTALRDIQSSSGGNMGTEMAMFVSQDGNKWQKAKFPHGHGLRENAYTVVDSTLHSLVVDVLDAGGSSTGVLFTSDSEGVHFVKSLESTSRAPNGIVDFEHLENVEGVAIANVVTDQGGGRGGYESRKVRSMITWDDGSRWNYIKAPKVDGVKCNVDNVESCSLNLFSVTKMHNTGRVFSSTAPGFVMAVGSIGDRLLPYEECDTFLSTDAGRTWKLASKDAHKYEFGDQGSVLVIVDDEDTTNHISYTFDQGQTWHKRDLGLKMRAKILTTIPDSTSLKFLLIGTQNRKDAGSQPRHVSVFLDFATVGKRACGEKDFEKWYAEGGETKCLMGHKQWFKRRKADADCFVKDKFHDPVGREDPCPCTEEDYECDFGYARDDTGNCVTTTRETIPAGECTAGKKTFMGSSGYRKIPGDSCDAAKGVKKDQKVEKPCDQGAPKPGTVGMQRHEFPGRIDDHAWFPSSPNLLAYVDDGSIWESKDDGANWFEKLPDPERGDPSSRFLTMALHTHDKERGYLITADQIVWYTSDRGNQWHWFTAPQPANGLGLPILQFHPLQSDWLIWTGSEGCTSGVDGSNCHARSWYSLDHGRNWHSIEKYVRTCAWARDQSFPVDSKAIICESYKKKEGSQRSFDTGNNDLQLVWGSPYWRNQKVLFDKVVGFAVFEGFLVAAELSRSSGSIKLMISMDGQTFAQAKMPPNLQLDNKAYTVLDSVTKSLFLHVTTHATLGTEWGTILRSNGNGTYYSLSQEFVNRNEAGYVDFEKMLGLDGIALINVVSNADDASVSGRKDLQTRITHNDGGRWKEMIPPRVDAFGAPYECNTRGCSLHLHGFTEREDPRDSYSSPSAVGLMLGVGNVGKKLAPYKDSDTFLTRDGGFTWEEVHKDAHKWEFGDQGSIILLVNDEEPTDVVRYSLNEGLKWETFNIGERLRIKKILTVPEDTHRKFVLLGESPRAQSKSVAIHLDFSSITGRKCVLNPSKPESDDFELWSPSEERSELCLFGRQTYYYRRKRSADCFIGTQIIQPHSIVKNCSCTAADFECEFNHYRDASGECVLQPGTTALASDPYEQCVEGDDYWYDRTNVRKIPYSSCDGGARPDRGARHVCPMSTRRHGFLWWTTIIISPFVLAGLVGYWWLQRSAGGRASHGSIRLPDPGSYAESPMAQTLASVPWALVGLANTAWAWISRQAESLPFLQRRMPRTRASYGGYRGLAQDEDAAILRDYDEEDFDR